MSNRSHKEGVDAFLERMEEIPEDVQGSPDWFTYEPTRKDVEDAIRAYHEKAFKRQDNAPVDGLPASLERYVGPWEEKK